MSSKQEIIDLRIRMHQLVGKLAQSEEHEEDVIFLLTCEARAIMQKVENLPNLQEWFGKE